MMQAFIRPACVRSCAWLLSLLVVMALLLSPTADFAAQAAVNDTPTPVVTDSNVEEWTIGAGLVYWSHFCNEELETQASLKRKPVSGTFQQTLKVVDPPNTPDTQCLTFRNLLSSGEGLYYHHEIFGVETQRQLLRMPLGAPFEPEEITPLANDEAPNTKFVEDQDYLYWGNLNGATRILRTRKDGSSAVETVANLDAFASDLLLVGTRLFWVDKSGVWSVETNCSPLPCETRRQYDEFQGISGGYGLVYQTINNPGVLNDGFRIYWVRNLDNNYKIFYRFCNTGPAAPACFLTFAPGDDPVPLPDPPVTFYEAATNWAVGVPLLAEGNLFWTEVENAVNTTTGEVRRKGTGQGANAESIATAQSGLHLKLQVADNQLFFVRRGPNLGIYSLPLNAAPILRDFNLEAFEVTQGIQNLANDVPLVAKKATYVRAYAKQIAGPNTPNVEIHLVGTRNDQPLPGSPLKPLNGVRALTTGGTYDRARLNDGWYFLLPENWTTAGNIKLQVVIDPRHLHNDPDLTNNVLPQAGPKQFNFQNQPPVCVMTVPVRTHNPLPSVYDPNVGLMVSNFDRLWPVPATWVFRDSDPVEELEFCSWHGFPYPCHGPYELSDGWGLTNGIPDRDKVITSLWTRALLSFNPDACDDIDAPVHFMGMVHPDADNGGAAGYASTISNQSWVQLPEHGAISSVWNAMDEGSTMAQELAHNHGRKHVNCGGPDNIDNSYPYTPCQIAPTGADSYYGFDIVSRQPIRPERAADFMSYFRTTWVSDYTWKALLDKFAATNVAAVAPLATDQGDQVFITGMVDGENPRGEITIALNVPAASLPPETRQMAAVRAASVQHEGTPHVEYNLRLLGPNGEVVADRPLVLLPMDDHSEESQASLFVEMFPKPAAPVAQLQLMAGSNIIFSDSIGINMPIVSIQSPTAGQVVEDELTIQWTASDPDADDRLTFTVQYSHDNGASWRTMAINRASTPDFSNSLTISVAGVLQGNVGNTAMVRVLANDGYNTQIATSQAFTVKNSPPFVAITAPANGQTLPGGETVLLQGTATDPEDGGLDASKLQWQVDGVGYGAGAAIAVDGLASMAHSASLAATDANSQTVTTTVNFTLAPLSVPHAAAPTLDGLCNDDSYVTSISLPLRPYPDATQANVRLVRSDDYLWVCFANLKLGTQTPGAYVSVRADIDNSRNSSTQATDVGFFVGENGDVYTRVGNGAGDFIASGPGGLQGQMVADDNGWSAELRIDGEALNSWGHLISLAVGHHAVTAPGDDYLWPFHSQWGKPNTWSAAALGIQPTITLVSPSSASVVNATAATVLGPSRPITVEGSNLVSGTQVSWNGAILPTTWITTEVLSAMVTDTLFSAAGIAQITARSPDNITSVPVEFMVEAAAPVITSLSPTNIVADSASFQLTINGSNFAPNAVVRWNGVALTTQFVNATQLKVQIADALLDTGRSIGVTVENPTPTVQISSIAPFVILPAQVEQVLMQSYLPGLFK